MELVHLKVFDVDLVSGLVMVRGGKGGEIESFRLASVPRNGSRPSSTRFDHFCCQAMAN
jgi:hypothetical protein